MLSVAVVTCFIKIMQLQEGNCIADSEARAMLQLNSLQYHTCQTWIKTGTVDALVLVWASINSLSSVFLHQPSSQTKFYVGLELFCFSLFLGSDWTIYKLFIGEFFAKNTMETFIIQSLLHLILRIWSSALKSFANICQLVQFRCPSDVAGDVVRDSVTMRMLLLPSPSLPPPPASPTPTPCGLSTFTFSLMMLPHTSGKLSLPRSLLRLGLRADSHNVPSTARISKLKKLTDVCESFCELNFKSWVLSVGMPVWLQDKDR